MTEQRLENKCPTLISCQKVDLLQSGFSGFNAWLSSNRNHIYVGENVYKYVKNHNQVKLSFFCNPFSPKIFGAEKAFELYKNYLNEPEIQEKLYLLSEKVLGVFDKDSPLCNGLALIDAYMTKFEDCSIETLCQETDSTAKSKNIKLKRKNKTVIFHDDFKRHKNEDDI